jgi:hypothetical protein
VCVDFHDCDSPGVGGCGYSLQANIKRHVIAIKHSLNRVVSDVGKPIGVDMLVVLTETTLKRGSTGNDTVADAIRIVF